ncbi:histidine kinase [Chitinophaga sp. Mgbs1]|uniref:Histidine kinase n=1 Tax=Chitinophaga solisilvae TaxID=1233460 RepID=A0A3S1B3F7_9BACT|nr:histidine kinase [Chitinophaga solisilvae]
MGKSTTQEKLFNRYYRIFIFPMIFLLYYLLSYLVNPFSGYWEELWKQKWTDILIEGVIMMIFCALITEMSLIIARQLNKIMPWNEKPIARSFIQLLLQLVSVGLLLAVLYYTLFFIFGPPPKATKPPDKLDEWQFVFVCSMLAILISAVHTGHYFLQRWKTSMLEASELKLKAAEFKQIAMQAQLQSLKLQLDPHFMFNNFSALSALIMEDKDVALSFLENLAKVYRYMITNLNNDIITLAEEEKIIRAFAYLIKIRHGDNVVIDIDIPASIAGRGVPPITLQLLIENAIKHNMATAARPLLIKIYEDDSGRLIVSNRIQRIRHQIQSTKLGLENIRNRYRILSDQQPVIKEEDGMFIVVLPVLDI